MPLVTVITGYYNRAEALDVTIDSIMNQTFNDFEFIIFNDCSTDDTKERLDIIVRKYNDPRIIVKNFEKNIGFVDGLILCISESSGKYICIQGSGDYSYPRRLELQVEALDSNDDVVVVGGYYENFVEDRGITRLRDKVADGITKSQLIMGNVFSHGEVMFRKDIYQRVGGYRNFFKNCQDYDLWLRMIDHGHLHTVKELLYKRYIRYDGVSYQPSKYLKQVRYFYLCQKINKLNTEEQVRELTMLSNVGISDAVDVKMRSIQKRILSAVLRSAAWQKYNESKELARIGINNPFLKVSLLVFIYVYSSRILWPVRQFISRKIGLAGN
jgi:glycosyltransferase involved in cell wall biosynthesis